MAGDTNEAPAVDSVAGEGIVGATVGPQPIAPLMEVLAPTPPRVRLTRLRDVRGELAKVYADARHGRIDTQDASRLAFVLGQLGKLIEAEEFERRLTALEGGR
jgi:hypothetical protein